MAFILRSSKYVCNFLGFTRRASLTCRRKKALLLECSNFPKFNEIISRTAIFASAKTVQFSPVELDKAISDLHNNVKAKTVELDDVRAALNIAKDTGILTSAQLILLLKCCGQSAFKESEEVRVNLAKTIWETAKNLGTELDISHYNSLIGVFIENHFKFLPQNFLLEIQEANLEPNIVTYRRLLKALCQQGNIQEAGEILEQMKQKRFALNENDFCSLIQGHCETGELEKAIEIFKVMQNKGIEPTIDSYVYLLIGYAKFGKVQEIQEVLHELNEKNIQLSDSHLLNIVYTLIVNNYSEHIDLFLEKMKKSDDYDKTLMKIVHRLLHQKRDNEAFKLFEVMTSMNYVKDFVKKRAHTIAEHFVINRSPNEVIEVCRKMEEQGWISNAFSHAMKVVVLKSDNQYCSDFFRLLKKNGVQLRLHYFWPIIVRFSQNGNSGIFAALKIMSDLNMNPCYNTVKSFIKERYQFSDDLEADIEILKKHNVKVSYLARILLNDFLRKRDFQNAAHIAQSYGVYNPYESLVNTLVRCFADNPGEVDFFLDTLYCLAHDFDIYNKIKPEEERYELSNIFDTAFNALLVTCPKDVILNVLQKASNKKLILTPNKASLIRNKLADPNVEALLTELTKSNAFKFDENIWQKKFKDSPILSKSHDPNNIQNLANFNELTVEKELDKIGSDARMEDYLAVLAMFARLKNYNKAFEIIDRIRDFFILEPNEDQKRRFRIIFGSLAQSGDVENMIKAYEVGESKGLIHELHGLPVVRAILMRGNDLKSVVDKYLSFFSKIKSITSYFLLYEAAIRTQDPELVNKLLDLFSNSYNRGTAYTVLYITYKSLGLSAEAKKLLGEPFNFRTRLFVLWISGYFTSETKTFEETLEIIDGIHDVDRVQIYEYYLNKFREEKNIEKIKTLWLQCQEDNITDPELIENISRCLKGDFSDETDPNRLQSIDGHDGSDFEDVRNRKDRFEGNKNQSLNKQRVFNTVLRLAAEGDAPAVIELLQKYKFGKRIDEVVCQMLENGKEDAFFELLNSEPITKMISSINSCFTTHKDMILSMMRTNEDFFQKFLNFSLRCYEEKNHDFFLTFCILTSIQLPGKMEKAEELLRNANSSVISRFRNYVLSYILLRPTNEITLHKKILESEILKDVFSETLHHFYERFIQFSINENDMETALLYLQKAQLDGTYNKLNKDFIQLLNEKALEKGLTFPVSEEEKSKKEN